METEKMTNKTPDAQRDVRVQNVAPTPNQTSERQVAEKQRASEEKESQARKRRRFSWKAFRSSLFDVGIILVGGTLIWLGGFGDSLFLNRFFSFLDVIHWSVLVKLSFVATIITIVGWIRIFYGFLSKSLDEHETALAARFMRMSFFITLSLWTAAYAFSDAMREKLYFGWLSMSKFGKFDGTFLTESVCLILLATATAYFVARWAEMKFFA